MTAPGIRMQVMNDVPAANQQHTFIAQRRQPFSDFAMKVRRLSFVDAQLHYRNISLRKNVTEHGPGSVVESPTFFIELDRNRVQQILNSPGQFGTSGSGILDLIKFARKATKVMNRAR